MTEEVAALVRHIQWYETAFKVVAGCVVINLMITISLWVEMAFGRKPKN